MEIEPNESFRSLFCALTGNKPFPWQKALYDEFVKGEIPPIADLPTGLGKTSVVAIWLIALIAHPEKMPRRLVYVVNRRTVVDQTTAEVGRIRKRLEEFPDWRGELAKLCAIPAESPLAISTLRGQFADNREWCADPARPAVIVGTVDMIGSGLLFSRYSCGFKTRPHHAALLGQDALLIHDEAHLEPAFQKLLADIVAEQRRCKDSRPLRVLELSATIRETTSPFCLTADDENDERIKQRLFARKRLILHSIADEKQLSEKLADLAAARRDSGRAVLVFARSVDVVQRVAEALERQKLTTVVLTGTMRGKERDELAEHNPKFLRFLQPSSLSENSPRQTEGTVYLIATSAGEVGVNISADDLICDLSTYESIAQRFGRVNRFGNTSDTAIELIYPESFKKDDPLDAARARTLELLQHLKGDASPDALRRLDPAARSAAFSPPPEVRPVTDILFDAWAFTSVRDALPGRPPVAPYLHGEPPEWELPETYVAWREEVRIIKDELLAYYKSEDLSDLLDDYPLKPHELLRDRSYRVREQLAKIWERVAETNPEAMVWIIGIDESIDPKRLSVFADKESESLLFGRTILLPPSVGGLSDKGTLDGKMGHMEGLSYDVASEDGTRHRVFSSDQKIPDELVRDFRLGRVIDRWRASEDDDENQDPAEDRYWLWLEKRSAPTDKGGIRAPDKAVLLEEHATAVQGHTTEIVRKLALLESLSNFVILAAKFHDLGKRRKVWQLSIGNPKPDVWYAKSGKDPATGKPWKPCDICRDYRHELGSLRDAELEDEFQRLGPDERDLVLHLIAAHHGRARPHFPIWEAFDPEPGISDIEAIATEVPRRFARLQQRFGRWGLAYLESLLRAADYAASAGISPKTTSP
ncbi:MAG TPA: type I-U CRISPR-associated helicase/endonuclease Cas3 [Candidatus Saccharimonadales bacterium]|nr:type I-U CRISPR-associated helicase/endonuclease Cas3 [Candidatus Saccharimonadales bacterium]